MASIGDFPLVTCVFWRWVGFVVGGYRVFVVVVWVSCGWPFRVLGLLVLLFSLVVYLFYFYFWGGVFICRGVITRRSSIYFMCVALGLGLFSIHVGCYSCFFMYT